MTEGSGDGTAFTLGLLLKVFVSEPSVHKGKPDPMGMHCPALDFQHFNVGGGQEFLFNHSYTHQMSAR